MVAQFIENVWFILFLFINNDVLNFEGVGLVVTEVHFEFIVHSVKLEVDLLY